MIERERGEGREGGRERERDKANHPNVQNPTHGF